ncbi:hypothetical protein DXG01_007165 [Tephrocybe rancida]|nr:hypothetical protein DXG01_007165 [Tephrocybe rancida]
MWGWDGVYAEELDNFEEIGDEGEIWFGEESVERMVEWAVENAPSSSMPSTVEIGSGNGTLLFALAEAGYATSHLCGIDYSAGAVKLAKSIAVTREKDVTFDTCDFLQDDPPLLPHMTPKPDGVWDLVLDKGTFDAIALGEKDENGNSPAAKYPGRVAQILKPGGCFLITCMLLVMSESRGLMVARVACNFTDQELQAIFSTRETRFMYQYVSYSEISGRYLTHSSSRIEHPTFEFGGKKGSIVASVAFQKIGLT